jgi:hypothetical protein
VAFAATRFLEGSSYNVSATDLATFGRGDVAVVLDSQAVPIARAMRVNPTAALPGSVRLRPTCPRIASGLIAGW